MICKHGITQPRTATVTLHRGNCTIIIKEVPAEVCDTCSEYYLSKEISEKVLKIAEDAVARGAEVEIVRFAA